MHGTEAGNRPGDPEWLNRSAYPFDSHWFEAPAGGMHYADEGRGAPIVFVHGNPAWSFQYRNAIRALSDEFRCIAPDHLGFGFSDKPFNWSYLPRDHAENFARFIDSLDLSEKLTLVVNDWGGPIGLSYALQHPDRIRALAITNTWMWPVRGDFHFEAFSRFMGGALGRYLIREHNFFARSVVKQGFGVRSRLTPEIHRHYQAHLAAPRDRKGSWVFPREILGSSGWLADLWRRRDALAGIPALLAWGLKDIAFRRKELDVWRGLFPAARVLEFEDCGHFVAEEKPQELARALRELLA